MIAVTPWSAVLIGVRASQAARWSADSRTAREATVRVMATERFCPLTGGSLLGCPRLSCGGPGQVLKLPWDVSGGPLAEEASDVAAVVVEEPSFVAVEKAFAAVAAEEVSAAAAGAWPWPPGGPGGKEERLARVVCLDQFFGVTFF